MYVGFTNIAKNYHIMSYEYLKGEHPTLSNKREIFINNVSKIKRYKYNLKEMLKNGRKIRNIAEFCLEDKLCSLLQMYHIKREAWFGGAKLNGVNCRRLMDKN